MVTNDLGKEQFRIELLAEYIEFTITKHKFPLKEMILAKK